MWGYVYLYRMGQLLEIIFVGFVLYMLYKLVFNLIVPVSKATSAVRDKMKQMQEEQMRQTQQKPRQTSRNPDTTTTDGEYIEFEEVK
jgi:hypothetical protein